MRGHIRGPLKFKNISDEKRKVDKRREIPMRINEGVTLNIDERGSKGNESRRSARTDSNTNSTDRHDEEQSCRFCSSGHSEGRSTVNK